jgi:hypothetical protein
LAIFGPPFSLIIGDKRNRQKIPQKSGKISVTNFSHRKNKGDHLRHNRVFDPFFKLFLGLHFWTFLKMSKIDFPFGFLEKSCY